MAELVSLRRVARSNEVPQGLLLSVGHPDRGQVTALHIDVTKLERHELADGALGAEHAADEQDAVGGYVPDDEKERPVDRHGRKVPRC